MSDAPVESEASATTIEWEDPSSLPVPAVRELFLTLSKALRSYQLYDRNNPVFRRFVGNLKEAFARVWETRDELQIIVEEDRFLWMGEEVYREETRSGSLAFLVYRDGVRELTLRRGIEDTEIEVFLDVLHKVRSARDEEDDLVTMLWDLDLEYLSYGAVDLLPEGTLMRADGPGDPSDLDVREILDSELGEDAPDSDPDGAEAASEATVLDEIRSVRPEDFNPTLYALDERERAYMEDLYKKELARNTQLDVLLALFDRLEDEIATEARQEEIVGSLRQLLPTFLRQGRLREAARLLRELEVVQAESGQRLAPGAAAGIERLLEDFSSPEAVRELVHAVEDGAIRGDSEDLGLLLRHLRPAALGPLLARTAEVNRPEARRSIEQAIQSLAKGEEERLTGFLSDPEPSVVAGAVRLMGALRHRPAAPALVRLLDEGPPEVRQAVLEAARQIPTSALASALARCLTGPERELRIGAARVLSEIQYTPATGTLRKLLEGREIRSADLSEKMALFSAYADLAGEEGVAFLDRLLNHKSLLGRREPSEIRACAALALGRIRGRGALQAIARAEDDGDPVVRSAVKRARNPGGTEKTDDRAGPKHRPRGEGG